MIHIRERHMIENQIEPTQAFKSVPVRYLDVKVLLFLDATQIALKLQEYLISVSKQDIHSLNCQRQCVSFAFILIK